MNKLLIGLLALGSVSAFAKVDTRCLKETELLTGAKRCSQTAIYKASEKNAKVLCSLDGLELTSFATEEVTVKGFNGSVQFLTVSPSYVIPSMPMENLRIIESIDESGPSFAKVKKNGFRKFEVISDLICN